VELYIHFPIWLHGILLNELSTWTTLNLCKMSVLFSCVFIQVQVFKVLISAFSISVISCPYLIVVFLVGGGGGVVV
jgi:hypothetical protein